MEKSWQYKITTTTTTTTTTTRDHDLTDQTSELVPQSVTAAVSA